MLEMRVVALVVNASTCDWPTAKARRSYCRTCHFGLAANCDRC